MQLVTIPVTPFQQNCLLLWDEATRRAAVVDPGGDVPRILAEAARRDLTVEKIVLTHGHIDHAGGAAELRDALRDAAGTAPPIEGPEERDLFLLQGLATQGQAYGLTEARVVLPDRWLAEGDTVEMAGTVFDVLHCPGHTPGHVVLVDRTGRFAIVGDVVFRGSVGRTDFPYGSHSDLLASIHDKLLPLGDDVAFLCGHGPGSTLGVERRSNPFLRA